MFVSIGIPIATILFLSITVIMYLTKKKYNDFQNNMFKFLLSLTFLLLFTEIGYVLMMTQVDKYPLLTEIVCRLFLSGVILWIVTFIFYVWIIGKANVSKEKQEKIRNSAPIIIVLSSSLLSIINDFFTIEYEIHDGLYEIVGPATYLLYIIAGVLLLFLFITLVINRKNYPTNIKVPIYFTLLLILLDTLFHIFVAEINDLTLLLSLAVTSLYFTIENQDRMLLKEVEESKQKSEKINKAKTEFLSSMSHEIRTPMTTIMGFSDLLQSDENISKETIKEDIANIQSASNNLLDLINYILELSRIESEEETINESTYSLTKIITSVDQTLKLKTDGNKVWYNIDINKDTLDKYKGDYQKVLVMIISLVNNAIKFTNYGSINVSIRNKTEGENKYIVFEIVNTGAKMPVEYYNDSYSDYSKLDYDSDNTLDSTFLGVVVAKRFVDLFENSSITFENLGDETKCTVLLCQKPEGETTVSLDYKTKEENDDLTKFKDKKVLIIDDSSINLTIMERLLKKYGVFVSKISSGEGAIDIVKKNKFDLIFVDYLMSGLDGVETMNIIRRLLGKDIPIVSMTTKTDINSNDYYKTLGFNGYISKPVNKKELDNLLYNVFVLGGDDTE